MASTRGCSVVVSGVVQEVHNKVTTKDTRVEGVSILFHFSFQNQARTK